VGILHVQVCDRRALYRKFGLKSDINTPYNISDYNYLCAVMRVSKEPHLLKWKGITAIIINNSRMLIMKRRYVPFRISPGIWTFIAGGKKNGERYDETAYREIYEEAGIPKEHLMLFSKHAKIMKFYAYGKKRFYDYLYVFYAKNRKVKRNIENTDHRWASIDEIRNQRKYTNVFANKHLIERLIERAVNEERRAKS
jgi:8-oxo-dGTP pyrophosphatase MutT (NUDIX family)